MSLVMKGLVGGLVIMAIAYAADHSTRIAGLLIMLPVMSLLGYSAVALSSGSGSMREVVRTSLIALPVWIAYAVALYLALGRLAWPLAIVASLLVWLVAAMFYLKLT